jgi:tetratricopeptide (TPR) repeat protein
VVAGGLETQEQGERSMKHFIAKVSAFALLVLFAVSTGSAIPQKGKDKDKDKAKGGQSLEQTKPGEKPGSGGPQVSKEEDAAYKAVFEARTGDPKKLIEVGEAFVMKYPMSVYNGAVYAELSTAYLSTAQEDKFLDAGNKALAINPDNVDVLPLMAMAIPRRVNSKTTDAPQQLQKALAYGKRGIELLNAMLKPAEMDDATFEKVKNDKLAMCHSGLGVASFQLGKYPEAIAELNQSVMLASTADPVDYYLLGKADQATNHFTDATAAFTKCSAAGPLQPQCKAGLDQVKKDSQNQLEAPK